MLNSPKAIGILLAAGGSTRMGQPKQLLLWQGKPLIIYTAAQLFAAGCERIIIVLGARATDCRETCNEYLESDPLLDSAIVWLENPNWSLGQSSSLRLALDRVPTVRGDSTHFLVALCDQPRLQAEHYRALMERAVHDQVRVAAARYAEGVGVPACFGHECLPDLQALRHDEGAKAWIRSLSRKQVAEVNFGEATGDVDTASDWAKLCQ